MDQEGDDLQGGAMLVAVEELGLNGLWGSIKEVSYGTNRLGDGILHFLKATSIKQGSVQTCSCVKLCDWGPTSFLKLPVLNVCTVDVG